MKQTILSLICILLIFSCKDSTQEKTTIDVNTITSTTIYPDDLNDVFDNHGSLDIWKSMNTMSYEIVKEESNEKQIIVLQNRWERIEAPLFTSGYDGTEYWV